MGFPMVLEGLGGEFGLLLTPHGLPGPSWEPPMDSPGPPMDSLDHPWTPLAWQQTSDCHEAFTRTFNGGPAEVFSRRTPLPTLLLCCLEELEVLRNISVGP